MAKLNLPPEERKRRSELAKALHNKVDPVTGRKLFGGRQPGGGRPKKKRVTEVLNEKIENDADEIYRALKHGLKSESDKISLQAARQMVDISIKEIEYQMKEDKGIDEMATEELIDLIYSGVHRLNASGEVTFDFIDGNAEEIGEQPELEEYSQDQFGDNA